MPRQLIISIDGDGFIYRTAFDGKLVGEVMFERVLTQYPFRFCASFIAGEHQLYPNEFDLSLARRILELDNVDAASHSWSHPHDWREPVDLELEIGKSVSYINQHFLSPGKTADVFLWTGKCNPGPDALAMTSKLGLWNLNGGDAGDAWSGESAAPHFHHRAPSDWEMMGMSQLLREAASRDKIVHVYPLILNHPGNLGGFKGVIDYFESHPDSPVHVYIHWYTAVRQDSLSALMDVLEWCKSQDLVAISVADYLASVAPKREPIK